MAGDQAGLLLLAQIAQQQREARPCDATGDIAVIDAVTIADVTPLTGHSVKRPKRLFAVAPALLVILGLQAALSFRLLGANTAFQDEALYLVAGHMEWARWLHGTPILAYPTYFSGAPVIYPPLGALADDVGGLAGARLLSLCFMLGATGLLYGTATRLFSRRAALCAAAMFAVLGPAQVLSAFATYDAMAIFLLGLSAWLVARAQGRFGELFLVAAGLALALADATKYATALWTPVVLILAGLVASEGSWPRRAFRAGRVAAYAAIPLAVALLGFGGKPYITGILFTTLTRQAGDTSPVVILGASLKWLSVVLALAAAGTVVSFRTSSLRAGWTCAVLAGAGLLAPFHQAQIHLYTSVHKHVVFGAWFAAMAAGVALAKASEVNEAKGWRVGAVAAGITLFIAVPQATYMFHGWPDAARMTADLRHILPASECPCLISQPDVVNYYLPATMRDSLTGPYAFWYWSPVLKRELNGTPAYEQAIRDHYFAVVVIDRGENPALVQPVTSTLAETPGYFLEDIIPIPHWGQSYIQIWRRSAR